MVRTKGDNGGRKAVAAKAPRKQLGGGGSSSGGGASFTSPSGKNKYSGGNPVKWWPTPSWQKGVAEFFPRETKQKVQNSDEDQVSAASGSSSSPGSSSASSSPGHSTTHPGVSVEELAVEPIED